MNKFISCNVSLFYRLIFEMLSKWPERSTFKSMKPINFKLYKEMIEDPIALDPILGRLDINSPNQVKYFTTIMKTTDTIFRIFSIYINFVC